MSRISHQTVRLGRGRHHALSSGEVCVMELASILAGERLTDHPASVSPVLAAFMRGYNDALDDERRQSLIPLAPACVGTGPADPEVENERRRIIVAHAGSRGGRLLARFWVREGATMGESGCELVGRRLGRQVACGDGKRRQAEIEALVRELIFTGRGARRDDATRLPSIGTRTSGHERHERTAQRRGS